MTKRRRRPFGFRASRCPTMELRPPRNGRRRRPEPTYRHSVPCGLGVEPFRQPAFHVAPSVILRARGKRAMRPIALRRPAASSASIARNLPGGGRRSVTCPRPSDLLRGKIIGFGLLSLVEPFAQAGLGVAPDVAVTARALQTAFAGRPVKNVRSSRRDTAIAMPNSPSAEPYRHSAVRSKSAQGLRPHGVEERCVCSVDRSGEQRCRPCEKEQPRQGRHSAACRPLEQGAPWCGLRLRPLRDEAAGGRSTTGRRGDPAAPPASAPHLAFRPKNAGRVPSNAKRTVSTDGIASNTVRIPAPSAAPDRTPLRRSRVP